MVSRVADLLVTRWKTFVALAVVLPVVLTIAASTVLQQTEASVGLWARTDPSSSQAGAGAGGASPAHAQAEAIMQVISTNAFADALRKAMDRDHVGADASERNRLAAAAIPQFRATAAGSHLVVLTSSCDPASTCVQVLAAAVEAYDQQASKLQAAENSQIQAALGSQVDDAQNALVQTENAVATYLALHPGRSLSSASTDPQVDLLLVQLTAAKQQVTSLQGKLTDLQVAAASRAAEGALTSIDPARVIRRGILGDGGIAQAALIFAGCLLVATAYLFLLSRLDDTALDSGALERRLHIPLLVAIPRFSAMRRF
jgi:hypothetical protein